MNHKGHEVMLKELMDKLLKDIETKALYIERIIHYIILNVLP